MPSWFFTLPLPILVHIGAALCAIAIGPFAIWRQRRDRMHKLLGYAWVLAMATLCLSSFAIHSFGIIGPFSPIHALAVWVLWDLWRGVNFAISGQIARHEKTMKALYINSLYGAGALTFLPGRVFNQLFFSNAEQLGYVAIIAVFALLFALRRRANVTGF